MSAITERLSVSLAHRYSIERGLGQVGMPTVQLAHDVEHDRQLVTKIPQPGLAAAAGTGLFAREIETTGNAGCPGSTR